MNTFSLAHVKNYAELVNFFDKGLCLIKFLTMLHGSNLRGVMPLVSGTAVSRNMLFPNGNIN